MVTSKTRSLTLQTIASSFTLKSIDGDLSSHQMPRSSLGHSLIIYRPNLFTFLPYGFVLTCKASLLGPVHCTLIFLERRSQRSRSLEQVIATKKPSR